MLAGFAFTALIYLIPRGIPQSGGQESQSGKANKHVLLALVFAFMDLIIVALLYSHLAAERGCSVIQGRAASEELLGAVPFAFSVLTLLYAIVLMVDSLDLDDLAEHVRFVVTGLGPPWAMFLVILAARTWRSRPGNLVLTPETSTFPSMDVSSARLCSPTIGFRVAFAWFAWDPGQSVDVPFAGLAPLGRATLPGVNRTRALGCCRVSSGIPTWALPRCWPRRYAGSRYLSPIRPRGFPTENCWYGLP